MSALYTLALEALRFALCLAAGLTVATFVIVVI